MKRIKPPPRFRASEIAFLAVLIALLAVVIAALPLLVEPRRAPSAKSVEHLFAPHLAKDLP